MHHCPLPVDAAHAEVFDFEELLDAVFRAFAADAALLHAAEGGDFGRDDALVDADDAVFQRLGDAPDAADVAAVARPTSRSVLIAVASVLKRRSSSSTHLQQRPGIFAKFLEQDRIYGLVEKAMPDRIADRQTATENGIVIFLNDSLGQQHLY